MTDHSPQVHISSAVVSVLPACQAEVVAALSQMKGVEVFHQAASKIVIVMEAPQSGMIGGRLAEIATLNGVLSANMVFEQIASLAELGEQQ